MATLLSYQIPQTYAEKCYDIKYEEDGLKMPGTSHGDNNPSEKQLKEMIFEESATLCEIAHCVDNAECKGELDGKQLKDFYNQIAFESGSEDQQDCIKHRADLPDDGRNALQAYEIMDCAVEDY